MLTFKQFLTSPSCALSEGFTDISVQGSDSASDLEYTVSKAVGKARRRIESETGGLAPDVAIEAELVDEIIEQLEIGLEDKGNAYNTHGTLNVAMVMDEYYDTYRRFPAYRAFAKSVAVKLKSEALSMLKRHQEAMRERQQDSQKVPIYISSMNEIADRLLTWAK